MKFFHCNKKSRKKSENKKFKSLSKKEEKSDKVKHKEFETPHKIAEAVREQSLRGNENNKTKTADAANAKKKLQCDNKQHADVELSILPVDENGNELKVLPGKINNNVELEFNFYNLLIVYQNVLLLQLESPIEIG